MITSHFHDIRSDVFEQLDIFRTAAKYKFVALKMRVRASGIESDLIADMSEISRT